MKKLLTILLILSAGIVKAQTVIPATTTVDSLSGLINGSYRFFRVNKDTVDLSKDTIMKCPICPLCPPPVVCPPPAKQRTAVAVTVTITATNKNILITYDDGSTSTL